jgi:integrase
LQDLVIAILGSGFRKPELLVLIWHDIDWRRGTLTVRAASPKRRETRTMPLRERLTVILKTRTVASSGDSIIGCRAINKTFRRVVLRAGLSDGRFHDLRHAVGTRLIRAGLSVAKVKEVLGHQAVKMTRRDTHLNWQEKAEAVTLLNHRNRQQFSTDAVTVRLTIPMDDLKTLAN